MLQFDPRLVVVHDHAYENIQFADRKALFLATVNLLAINAVSFVANDTSGVLAISGIAVLGLATVICASVIWPRSNSIWKGWSFKPKRPLVGVVDANHIANLGSFAKFERRLAETCDDQWAREYKFHLWKLARIHKVKYVLLRLAILTSAAGWVILAASQAIP